MHLPLTPPPQMMVLELSGNQITAVGDNVGNMAMLRDLDLSGNAVTRVADAVCGLSKLEVWREEGRCGGRCGGRKCGIGAMSEI